MIRLLRTSRAVLAAIFIAAIGAPAGVVAQSELDSRPRPTLEIRAGQASDFSRIEFHWNGAVQSSSRRDGREVAVRFNRNALPDMAPLKVFPPRWLESADARAVSGGLEIVLTLAEGADAKVGRSDGVTYVNLFEADPVRAQAVAEAEAPVSLARAEVSVERRGSQSIVNFEWSETVGAAMFRRGDVVWAVFDAAADIDLSDIAEPRLQYSAVETSRGSSWTIVRFKSDPSIPVYAEGQGSEWSMVMGRGDTPDMTGINLTRARDSETPELSAAVSGATRAIWLDDPVVGDRLIAVTALGPAKGVEARRRYAQLQVLPSVQGLVIEPRASNLSVDVRGDIVRIGRPGGLAVSSPAMVTAGVALPDAPRAAIYPSMINFTDWSDHRGEGFYHRYSSLLGAAMDEADLDGTYGGAPQVQARMAFARFLLGAELAQEAIGLLDSVADAHSQMQSDPEFRGLRGVAKVMAGRYEEAAVDFATPVLSEDPAAALWRGYIAVQQGRWANAREEFVDGYSALNQFEPDWRVRLARADAEAALNTGELEVARSQLTMAERAGASVEEDLATSVMRARLFEADHDPLRALEIYNIVAESDRRDLSAAATLYATRIKLDLGEITPAEAADAFDSLRFRWRGDALELATIRSLGDIYLEQGRYRQALEVLSTARSFAGDSPEGLALVQDLNDTYRELFYDGRADGLEPIQAVGLFYDFEFLMPQNQDGDLMVRRMVRRLVDVDLLDQAATLLEHQVNERLEGVARSDVATDLAEIYLMDRRPEEALAIINATRTTVLPNDLNSQRRRVASRALMELGRYDAAVEMIELERGSEAEELRAEIAWKRRDWTSAGEAYEALLGDRWRNDEALGANEETWLLRSSIGYSLADQQAALRRMQDRYAGLVNQANASDALNIALAGIEAANLSPSEFSRVIADSDTFSTWVSRTKARFRDQTEGRRAEGPAGGTGTG